MHRIALLLPVVLASCGGKDAAAPPKPAGKVSEVADVRITVTSVDVGPLDFGDTKSEETYIRIRLLVENLSDRRKINYSVSAGDAKLTDDIGNEYAVSNVPIFGENVEGATGSGSIYPGKSVPELLFGEPPVEKARTLTLTVSGDVVDVPDEFRFQFPAP